MPNFYVPGPENNGNPIVAFILIAVSQGPVSTVFIVLLFSIPSILEIFIHVLFSRNCLENVRVLVLILGTPLPITNASICQKLFPAIGDASFLEDSSGGISQW
jgi:hypothetical protein